MNISLGSCCFPSGEEKALDFEEKQATGRVWFPSAWQCNTKSTESRHDLDGSSGRIEIIIIVQQEVSHSNKHSTTFIAGNAITSVWGKGVWGNLDPMLTNIG